MKKYIISVLTLMALVGNMFCTVVYADGTPTITVSDATAKAGEEVDIQLSIKNNPGIIAVKLSLTYDNKYLELLKVTDGGKLNNPFFGNNIEKNPYIMSWNDDTASANMTYSGEFATLTFKVKDDAPEGSYPIEISCPAGEIYNVDLQDVDFTVKNGSIIVGQAEEVLDYTITSIQIKNADDELIETIPQAGSYYVEVSAIKNTDRSEKDYLIIATYDENNAFLDFTYMRGLYNKNQEISFGTMLNSNKVKAIKAFVLDGLATLNPLSNAYTFK